EMAAEYLRACADGHESIPGSFELVRTDGTVIACRAVGAALRSRSEDADALFVIGLAPEEAAPQLAALTRKIAELDREIQQRMRIEQELRAQREWLGVTLASIGDAVIATDITGAVIFMNPVAETLTGWTQAEALGRPLDEVFHLIDEPTRERV